MVQYGVDLKRNRMRLDVYKGFDNNFLGTITTQPLVSCSLESRLNTINYDRNYVKKLSIAILSMSTDDHYWILYEEFSVIKETIDNAIKQDALDVRIIKNNLYPDYYLIPFEVSDNLYLEIEKIQNDQSSSTISDKCNCFFTVYNSLLKIEDQYYGSFFNFEYEKGNNYTIEDFYPNSLEILQSTDQHQTELFIQDDVETYLRNIHKILALHPTKISVSHTNGETSKRIIKSLKALCIQEKIALVTKTSCLQTDLSIDAELSDIAKKEIGISSFAGFRNIRFYQNPDLNNKTIDISQGQLIQEIIIQAEKAYKANSFRDIFITASTGAGKSVMFQIPAVYLAKKHKKITIIIEPVKALMQDQKEKLIKNGYNRVEAFNSDLITQTEKEEVLKKIKEGEIDLLYLSPETLLSYSIETIIGEREIGLIIIDEAHIVTTWGVGFRPDYWYLGGYINRLRNQIQTYRGQKRKTYQFPICAFTATAVNGGIDDTISDTIISLYMENPIKYIGYVKRDNIGFDIRIHTSNEKLPKPDYEQAKTNKMNTRINSWLSNNEKTIVYFPYASLAGDAAKGVKGFAGIITDKRIGTYTGRNIDDLSQLAFNDTKKQTFEGFRNGTIPIMYATKAFGMGVDVDDVQNVYHYSVSGNLCDYVQEIGRAARKNSIKGVAATDFYKNDMTYMKVLFGMSQIRHYQIKAVLEGIYNAYKNRNGARSFLISPESFTYIFNGKGMRDEETCINKLKTCLLMLEKDLYDKFNFKVIISRPQSMFTKAFICIRREEQQKVLNSKYGEYLRFASKGRFRELQPDGSFISDKGDIYTIDLKSIWEKYNPNISFPQFKYYYFNNLNNKTTDSSSVKIMPEIREYIYPRQKVSIEARNNLKLCEIRKHILEDFEYICEKIYGVYKKEYFTSDDLAKIIRERFGAANSRIIANSLFDLVDPGSKCVKHRRNEGSGKNYFSLSTGNFLEYLRLPILKANIMSNLLKSSEQNFSGFMSLETDENSNIALKLLSVFDYITYEITGGEQPEIFIRLNDPSKIKSIVNGSLYYSNDYVSKAKLKHERDIEILMTFFSSLKDDNERWNFIENYFLGRDVLEGKTNLTVKPVPMIKYIDENLSLSTSKMSGWEELAKYVDLSEYGILKNLQALGVCIPEYIDTVLKKSESGSYITFCWPSKNVLICNDETPEKIIQLFFSVGWTPYRIGNINYEDIKQELR